MKVDILITPVMIKRGVALMRALMQGAQKVGIDARIINRSGDVDRVLVMYGMGGADRLPIATRHLEAGGRLLTWDAGYWNRSVDNQNRRYRVSIDGLHPPRFVMKGESPDPKRFYATLDAGVKFTPISGGAGPILLVGNGPKSNAIGAAGWSYHMAMKLKAELSEYEIAYRPKPKKPIEIGVPYDVLSQDAIAVAVRNASLVVCRHSNVAVDACLAGTPVVCEDGAAAAIYPRELQNWRQQPSVEVRLDFLARLAWWQWSQNECALGKPWPWLIKQLELK